MRAWWGGVGASAVVCFFACGGGGGRAENAPPDAGVDAAPPNDAGAADVVDAALPFPAFPIDSPQVISLGGPVLTTPNVVAIFDRRETNQAALVAFIASLGASDYWKATTSEYGVGALGANVRSITLPYEMPATVTGADVGGMIRTVIQADVFTDGGAPDAGADAAADDDAGADDDGGTVDAGAPWQLLGDAGPGPFTLHPETIYVLFTYSGTSISDESCDQAFGYHNSTAVTKTDAFSFAVISGPCIAPSYGDQVQSHIFVTAHELVESVTDPFYAQKPGYLRVDNTHIAWDIAYENNDELADDCNNPISSNVGGTVYTLPQIWSNAAAKAGHRRCVPLDPGDTTPSILAMPVFPNMVAYETDDGTTYKTEGVQLAVGDDTIIDLNIVSDAQTDGPITVTVFDIATLHGNLPELALTLDTSTAQNGDVLHLGVHRSRAPKNPNLFGSAFEVIATQGKLSQQSYGFVSVKN